MTYWTEEREAALRELATAGWSASQVAERLGGVTRHAVIGKINRLGLQWRNSAAAPTRLFKPDRAAPAPVKPVPVAPRREPSSADQTEVFEIQPDQVATAPKTLADPAFDERGACRWPLPVPDAKGRTLFCCNDRGALRPYCEAHARRAYTAQRTPEQVAAEAQVRRNRAAEARRAGLQGGLFNRKADR